MFPKIPSIAALAAARSKHHHQAYTLLHIQKCKNCGLVSQPIAEAVLAQTASIRFDQVPLNKSSMRHTIEWCLPGTAGPTPRQTRGPAWNIMFDSSARLIFIAKVSAPPLVLNKCSVIKLMDSRSECTTQPYTFLIWHKVENYRIVGHFTQRGYSKVRPTIVSSSSLNSCCLSEIIKSI